MQVTKSGSVRVDLVGGTLDLEPINLILPNVVTLNCATSLKAEVKLEAYDSEEIVIVSEDYDKTYEFQLSEMTDENLYSSNHFEEMSFVLQVMALFGKDRGIKVTLKSGAPACSGLGGSSAMGITLYRALCELYGKDVETDEAVLQVKGIESRILNKGMAGYQDYYPALLGGVLCLRGDPGKIINEQLYSEELSEFLEERLTLVYSGISRNSGINNWDVYKGFFDNDETIRNSMKEIAEVSYKAYQAILKKDWPRLLECIAEEGDLRTDLAPGIVPKEVNFVYNTLKANLLVDGMKMCGAGGGGCFILIHQADKRMEILDRLDSTTMKVLDFSIDKPHKG